MRPLSMLLALLLGVATAPALSVADDATPAPPMAGDERDPDWDWIQIATGEWLKGEITRMREKKLYFDSDELDDVTIDWADIETLVTTKMHTFQLDTLEVVMGVPSVRDGVVSIETADGVVEFERSQVLSVVPGDGSELDFWSAKTSLGLSQRSGNTDQLDLAARAEVKREATVTRFVTGYTGDYSELDDDKTANAHRVNSKFDVFLTRRFFLTVPSFEYYKDEFQNIDYRLSPGAGIGVEIYDTSFVEWDVTTGAIYQYTKFESVSSGDDTDDDVAAVAGTSLNFDLPRGIEWDNSYRVQIVASDIDKTNHRLESILDFDIWGPLDLELAFVFDRIERPQRDADGDRPESNDYRTTVGLALDF